MQTHVILAPSRRAGRDLADALEALGFQARFTVRNTKRGTTRPVVLAVAPLAVVNKACRNLSVGGF